MYVTTYSQAGKPGSVPTWLWPHDGLVYLTTKRDSLKAKRIRAVPAAPAGGQRPRMADYVRLTGPTDGATAAGGG
jgi:hypothetical protein